MTIQFAPQVPARRRGEIQLWLEQHVDRDTDFYSALVSLLAGCYVYLRRDWHTSPDDRESHMTGDVYIVSLSLCN